MTVKTRMTRTALTGLLLFAPLAAAHDGVDHNDNHSADASAQDTSMTMAHGAHHAHYSGLDYAFAGPETLTAGWVNLSFSNDGVEPHHIQLARIKDGVTLEQIQGILASPTPDAAFALVDFVGGVGMISGGDSAEVLVDMQQPGTYLALCFIANADGVPHLALGMIQVINVVAGDMQASDVVPTPDLVVNMFDFGYDVPAQVNAGVQTWQVVNAGLEPHELMVLKLDEGKTLADVQAFLASGSHDAMPGSTMMSGVQAMTTGYSNYMTFDFAPGNYVALCYVPSPANGGAPHFMLGMITQFSVVETTAQQ